MNRLSYRSVCFALIASLLLAVPGFAHPDGNGSYFFDTDGNWTQEGCHYDINDNYHCHEPDLINDDEVYLVALGIAVVGGIIWRAARRNARRNAKSVSPGDRERPKLTLEDFMRRDPVRLDVLPVKNSRGEFDGAQFRLSFRF